MNITETQLAQQYERVKKNGWLPYFIDAPYDVAPEITLGIGSRETNLLNILGDGGHGHGILQVDDRGIYRTWCSTEKWRDVNDSINMGAFVLRSKFNSIEQNKAVLPADVLKVAIAAYNCGVDPAVSSYLRTGGNPDFPTTGHNYSIDVMRRSAVFQRLLDNDK